MWPWGNFLEQTFSPGKIVVHINFDESSPCFDWTPPRRGLLTKNTRRRLREENGAGGEAMKACVA